MPTRDKEVKRKKKEASSIEKKLRQTAILYSKRFGISLANEDGVESALSLLKDGYTPEEACDEFKHRHNFVEVGFGGLEPPRGWEKESWYADA